MNTDFKSAPGDRRAAAGLAFGAWASAVAATSAFGLVKGPALAELAASGSPMPIPVLEGRVQAVFFIAWALASPVFGRRADRRGRYAALTPALLCVAAGSAGSAIASDVGWFVAARILAGLGGGGVWGAAQALAHEAAAPGDDPARNTARVQTAVSLAHLATAGAAALLAAQPWRWLFVVVAAVALSAAALAAGMARRSGPLSLSEPSVPVVGESEAVPTRVWASAVALGFVGVAGSLHAGYWLPNLVTEANPGLAPVDLRRSVALAAACLHFGGLFGILAAPAALRRWPASRVFGGACALAAVAFALAAPAVAGFGSSGLALAFAAGALGFAATGWTGLLAAYLPGLFPAGVRATGAGVAYNAGRVLTAGHLAIVGAAVAAFGPVVAVASGALLYLVGWVAAARLPRPPRPA